MADKYLVEPDVGFVKEIGEYGGDSLKKCFQCATCSVACPISPDTKPFPRKEMIAASWGLKDKLVGNGDIWLCHNCGDCSTLCPRGAKPGDVLAAIRAYAISHYAGFPTLGKLVNDPKKLPVLFAIPAVLFLVLGLILKIFGINWLNFSPERVVEHGDTVGHIAHHMFFSTWLVDLIFISTSIFTVVVFALGLKRMIAETQKFFNDNPEFYLYYRSGSTHLDDKYFVRTEISCTLNCSRFIYDPFFSTSHDYTLAAIKADEKIARYCNEELNKLKRWGRYRLVRSDMTWDHTKRDLILIIYGIHYMDSVNNGNASIKDLVKGFESLFNVDLSGYYHIFYEAIQRQQPFEYLDKMKETLTKLKEESDENKRQKRRNRK